MSSEIVTNFETPSADARFRGTLRIDTDLWAIEGKILEPGLARYRMVAVEGMTPDRILLPHVTSVTWNEGILVGTSRSGAGASVSFRSAWRGGEGESAARSFENASFDRPRGIAPWIRSFRDTWAARENRSSVFWGAGTLLLVVALIFSPRDEASHPLSELVFMCAILVPFGIFCLLPFLRVVRKRLLFPYDWETWLDA